MLVTAYHKNNSEKLIAIFVPIDTAPLMARLTASPILKVMIVLIMKCGQLVKSTITITK